jgi:glyoxylase-like metal-dependent hydrolase (beta-lactamase superfamily II)
MNRIIVLDLHFLGIARTIASFLIETEEGPVLVETGPHSTLDHLRGAVEAHNYRLEDIKHVLVTHIHLDHAGAAWALAAHGATIYMHPFGKAHMVDPSKLLASATQIYGDEMDRLWGTLKPIPEAQIKTPVHGEVLHFADKILTAWYTPGHAVHHIAYQMGSDLFTGDVAGVGINEGPAVPPCPPPDIHLEDWKKSIALMRKLNPERLYLTHFGMIDAPKQHLEHLEGRLDTYVAFVKEKALEGHKMGRIIKEFADMTLQDLEHHYVHGEDLQRYAAANPADMSVPGILRYLKKSGAFEGVEGLKV